MPSAVGIATLVLLGLFGLAVFVGGLIYLRDARSQFRRAWLATTATPTDLGSPGRGTQPLKLRGTMSTENPQSPPFLTETPAKLRFARIARPWPHALANWLALRATSDAEKRRTMVRTVAPTAVTLDVDSRRVGLEATPGDVVPVVPRSDWDETRRYEGIEAAPPAVSALLREREIDPGTLDKGWFESRLVSERRLALGDELRVFGVGTVERRADGSVEISGDDLVYTTAGWWRVALHELGRTAKSTDVGLFGLGLGGVALSVVALSATPLSI